MPRWCGAEALYSDLDCHLVFNSAISFGFLFLVCCFPGVIFLRNAECLFCCLMDDQGRRRLSVKTLKCPSVTTLNCPSAKTLKQTSVKTLNCPSAKTLIQTSAKTLNCPPVTALNCPSAKTLNFPSATTLSCPSDKTPKYPFHPPAFGSLKFRPYLSLVVYHTPYYAMRCIKDSAQRPFWAA